VSIDDRQIARGLLISDKIASVHVSNFCLPERSIGRR
jgi:hypothetical protein